MATGIRGKSIVLIVLAVFLMACSLGGLLPGGDKESVSSDEYRSEAGGYSFKPLDGYDMTEEFGMTQMLAPGADTETGPMIAIIGGTSEEELDNETLLASMAESFTDGELAEPKKVKVDGVAGLDVGIESTTDEEISGRMVIVMVEPTQQFVAFAVAPDEDWKAVSKDLDKLLKSVKFFTPAQIVVEEPAGEVVTGAEPGISAPSLTQEPVTTAGTGEMLRQWAVSAVASSQYAEEGWSASQATGEPNVEACQDDIFAWASISSDTVEWIELTYETAVIPYEVTVVQTYNPSQVVDITGIADDGTEYLIWEAEPEAVEVCPDFMTITIEPDKEVYINKLRITIDQSVLGLGWNEIDAVELVGIPRGGTLLPPAAAPVAPATGAAGGAVGGGDVPEGKGFLTTIPYIKYLAIPVNDVVALEPIIGPLVSSPSQLKPRPDHKDTYMFDIGGGMTSYTRVTTSGLIYWKDIGQVQAVDIGIDFDESAYDAIMQMAKDSGYQLPYTQVAQYMGSPGMVIRHYLQDDGRINIDYAWFNKNGDKLFVASYDGIISGTPTFVPKE